MKVLDNTWVYFWFQLEYLYWYLTKFHALLKYFRMCLSPCLVQYLITIYRKHLWVKTFMCWVENGYSQWNFRCCIFIELCCWSTRPWFVIEWRTTKTCIFLPQAFCHTQYCEIIHYTVTFLLILEQYSFSEVISEALCDHLLIFHLLVMLIKFLPTKHLYNPHNYITGSATKLWQIRLTILQDQQDVISDVFLL